MDIGEPRGAIYVRRFSEEDVEHLQRLAPFFGDGHGLAAFENLRMFEDDFALIARTLNNVAHGKEGV